VIHFWLRLSGFRDVNSLENRDPKVLERFADIAGPILSVPWGLTVGAPPFLPLPVPIFIDVLEPIYFEHSGPEAADDESYVEECHQRVLDAMQLALDQLMQERRLMRREQLRAGLHRATHVFSRATHG
jgi:hypothetical protein